MKLLAWILSLSLLGLLACGGQKPTQQTAGELFELAQTSHAEARYADAVLHYGNYVSTFPDSSQAAKCQFMVAYLYANELGEVDKARAAYEAFLQQFPESELRVSAEWELEHLGQNLSEIDVIPGD